MSDLYRWTGPVDLERFRFSPALRAVDVEAMRERLRARLEGMHTRLPASGMEPPDPEDVRKRLDRRLRALGVRRG